MLENIKRTWSRHCYGRGHCVTPLSNIAVLATNVIKMTEWPAYKMARDLANGKVFPVSEAVIMQTARKPGSALMAKLSPAASSSPRRLISSLSALHSASAPFRDGVGMAERVGKRGVREIVEAGCGRQIGSLGHGSSLARVRPSLVLTHLARPTVFLYSIFMARSISRTEKRSRGRPKKDPTSIHFTFLPVSLTALDAWIADQSDPRSSRPEAIRRLLEQAFAGKGGKQLPSKEAARKASRAGSP